MHPLKAYLIASGMTAAALAPRAGTAAQYLSNIMTGRRRPSPQLAEDISRATGGVVKAADLVFWKAKAPLKKRAA